VILNLIYSFAMRYLCATSLIAMSTIPALSAVPAVPESRSILCKTPAIASSCRWVHGRLSLAKGTPSYRLWEISTHHLFGILSGPGPIPEPDNEDPQVPDNLEKVMPHDPSYVNVLGDFEICPLESEKPGSMQMACIQSAKKLTTKK
jgi:hypothetical protein